MSLVATLRSKRLTLFFGVVVVAAICLPGLSLWYGPSELALPTFHSPLGSHSPSTHESASKGPWRLDALVDLGYIKYRGLPNEENGQTYWGGIRYAVAPEGDLRWKKPVAIEKAYDSHLEVEEHDATKPGPACMQQLAPWYGYKPKRSDDMSKRDIMDMREDCLLLNVRAPSERHDESLPVIVFIHGGGYNAGNAITEDRGSHLIQESGNSIILVETQYRLGVLGFLSSRAIREQGTANAGLLDQRAALEWVQRHIAAFGGDPSRVTVLGGSAGGGSVTAQLQLYGGSNELPFRAAISEYPWWQQFHDDDALEAQYDDLLERNSCKDLACLRAIPYDDFANTVHDTYIGAFEEHRFGVGDYYFGPSVDGTVLKELPSQAFTNGNFTKVPMLINHNALEGLPFTDTSISAHEHAIDNIRSLWTHADDTLIAEIDKLYPIQSQDELYFMSPPVSDIGPYTPAGDLLNSYQPNVAANFHTNSIFFASAEIFGDVYVNCGTKVVAKAMHEAKSPIWKLIYNSGYLVHGAFQAALLEANPAIHNETESQILARYIVSFVKHLNPNTDRGPEQPEWPLYGAHGHILNVNTTSVTPHDADPDNGPRCDFILENSEKFRV